MNLQGYFTQQGLALAAKLSAGAALTVTRVVAGGGVTADPLTAATLPLPKQTLTAGTPACEGDTATIPVTLAAALVSADYTLTELGVYAQDPDEGEILYKLYQLEEAVSITAGSRMVLRFYLQETVSQDVNVTVECSPAGILTESDLGVPLRAAGLDTEGRLMPLQRPLGLEEKCTTITDWNTAVKNGWYRTTTADENNNSPDGMAWYGFVVAYGTFLVVQEVYHAVDGGTVRHCRRWLREGVWSPWEWIDPPMRLGVEYRTAERYLEKPVYAKLVSFGAMPGAAYKTIAHGIADVERCVCAGGACGVFNLQGLKGVNAVDCGNTVIGIGTDDDTWTSYEAQVLVKYTKTTD